ncbi:MAG: HEAT repeat domain-containing protein, partial [Planctomycetota bacterium]
MPTLKTAPALISALLFLFLSSPEGASQEEPPRSVQIMLRMLTEQRARMPLAAYELLEESGHRAAFEAMIETARDPLQPRLLRARCVRHLAGFVTDPSLAGQLLRELTELALDAPEQGLRLLCVDELAETGDDSVVYLEAIVDHGTDPEVRARALGHHADSSPDQEWYVSLLTGVDRQRRSDTFDRDMQLVGATLRLAAFDEVVEVLELETLRGLVDAKDIDLRLDALEELVRRDAEDAAGLSKKRYETTALPLRERLASGALHVRYADEAFVEDLIEAGSAEEVDPRSRELVGRAAATALTIPLVGDLQRAMARGSLGERTVAATALRGDDSNRFRKNLVRLLEDEDAGLRILAAEELANWVGDPEALEGLLARLEEGPELGEGGRILRSATAVAAGDPTWDDRLREYLEHPAADVRGEALELLAERVGEDALVPLLEGALASNDWTRVSKGVELLVAERSPESVKAMIESLEVLDGRDQRMVADGLWRVSGLQLGLRPSAWKGWWSEVGEGFEPVDPTETAFLLEERRRQEES